MDQRPVLVLITAENCGACKALYHIWSDVESGLVATGLVRIVRIPLPNMGAEIDSSKFPSDLSRYRRWFPMLLLVAGPKWNEASQHTSQAIPLQAKVFNAILNESGEVVYKPSGAYSLNKEGIINWVKAEAGDLNVTSLKPLVPLTPKTAAATVLLPTAKQVCTMNINSRRY